MTSVTLGDHMTVFADKAVIYSTGPIEIKTPPVDTSYAISSAVSHVMTSGDLGDLRTMTVCRLWQPFYNSGTARPIEIKTPPVESACAVSSAVSNMVTSKGQLGFDLLTIGYCSHSLT